MIVREELQAWLDSQPEDREFHARLNDDCPIYYFLKEEKKYSWVKVFSVDVLVPNEDGRINSVLLPSWATNAQDKWMLFHNTITAKQAADELREVGNGG